jgi:hypothetical protein
MTLFDTPTAETTGLTQMQALSLWQPWASLIAIGAKTIETRSWGTRYRGRIAIHAAAKRIPRSTIEGPDGMIGAFSVHQEQRGGEPFLIDRRERAQYPIELPFGAVVATAQLVDCAQMGYCHSPYAPEVPKRALAIEYGGKRAWHVLGDTAAEVTDQLPYGDFRPGRWAWMLGDIRPIEPAIPARGRQQLFLVDLPMEAVGPSPSAATSTGETT